MIEYLLKGQRIMDQRSHGSEEEEEEVEEFSAEEEDDEEGSDSDSEEEEERSDWSDEPSPKRPAKNETLDRISALPEAILVRILSLLPMNEVIKTGSLSRKWQYLWTTVPNLVFTNHNKSPDRRVSDFVRFVDKTLILHRHSKIYRFTIDFEFSFQFRSHVDLWIRFAMSCDVEELSINVVPINGLIYIYILPEYTFSCSSVTRLELKCCNVVPKGLINWKSLKNLWLHTSEVNENSIHNILSGSPLLEVLELDHCFGFKRLDISSTSLRKLIIRGYRCQYTSTEKESILIIEAPNLHSLEITGELEGSWYRLFNMLSLVDANLSFDCTIYAQDCESYRNMFKQLLQGLNQVKELTLGHLCIRAISMLELKHWPSLPKCKWLKLNTSVVAMTSPGIGNLLQSSLDLETLIMVLPSSSDSGWFGASTADSDKVGKYWTSREHVIFPCLQRHLKTVKIVCFNGLELRRVLPFIEFLLKNACVLEKMVIGTQYVGGKHSSFALKELLEVARKLLNCPRASRNAVVMFPE